MRRGPHNSIITPPTSEDVTVKERLSELNDLLAGSWVWVESPSTKPTFFAASTLFAGYFVVTIILLLFVGFNYGELRLWTCLGAVFQILVLGNVLFTGFRMRRIFADGN
jgi:hypothetical protein